ncbi:MAG: sialidase family protein [Candidatus Methanomethyliaceae archaeon]
MRRVFLEELGGRKDVIEPPRSFPSCHAPTICQTLSGRLLLAFYAGLQEGAPDSVVLGVVRKGGVWSEPKVWVHVPRRAVANPRLFLGPDGAVWLLFGVNYGPRWCSGDTYLFVKRSDDEGDTWHDLELFWEQKGLLGKNRPLHEGNFWIFPLEWEYTWSATFLRSEDNGRTWELTGDLGVLANAHLIQPALVKLSDGRLRAYMRSQEGWIFISDSMDNGRTWSFPQPSPIPNNNSGLDVLRTRAGILLLACNPTGLTANPEPVEEGWPETLALGFTRWGPRFPLVLKISGDEGQTWPLELVLEEGPGEYSYPCLMEDADETIHLVYTYRRRAIAHVAFPGRLLVSLMEEGGIG